MSAQLDWVGFQQQASLFRDIRNQRSSVAEEKAILLKILGELMNKIPADIKSGGSVNLVRTWKKEREEAVKVAKNTRSSVQDIQSAISKIRKYHPESA